MSKSSQKYPVFDVWLCQGRMCTSNDVQKVADLAREKYGMGAERIRLLRGGCYGLCEYGPNMVVRRYDAESERPNQDDDRLSLRFEENETVYSGMTPGLALKVIDSHLANDAPLLEQTTLERLRFFDDSEVTQRVRVMRQKQQTKATKDENEVDSTRKSADSEKRSP